ncbi:YicC/YloC family endoribonuclease [Litchfieldia alkalitelluris]|uniref:YicC/YloC family endoribonuclease n=1 Tax=Litchfieldia alkalitelluris TaxID=304268 RepID=UPI00099630BB|nr:YicC/YloC family endoribonuclease [Litchfieldia alkalitelluris]
MMISMTGYGRAKKEVGHLRVIAEVKSVNHRFCEIHVRIPRQLTVIEDKIKKAINKYVQRGRIELFLTVEGEGIVKRNVEVDWSLMDHYFQLLQQTKERYALTDEITLDHLFNLEGVSSVVEEEANTSELEVLVIDTVHLAMKQFRAMRETEGEQLSKEIQEQTLHIVNLVSKIKELAPSVVDKYHERISSKVNEYLSGAVDENKIMTEVAIFADKADISEELIRLRSHATQLLETLNQQNPVGRKLDFIVQEMNRETNTIGAKANDYTIASYVVEMKSYLERIKEQVQNIE